MTTIRALKTLLFGETWLLPIGVAVVVGVAALLVRPLTGDAWEWLGGFALVAGVVCVLLMSVARSARAHS
jgi:hypothetical protein